MPYSSLPLESVRADPAGVAELPVSSWPRTLACVEQVLREGLELGPLTVLVGENGSGKSTLVEAIAQAYGLSPEGGSTGARHSTRESESPLHRALALRRGLGAGRWGFFLRAETMHGFFTYREQHPAGVLGADEAPRREQYHEMSHGESFLEVLGTHVDGPGLFVLDEPESALSFTGCLALVARLADLASSGHQQAIVATHSPVVAATPGARILEVGEWGLAEREWADLDLVQNWRGFLEDPQLYVRELLEE
jgi:predicted ATPase